MKSHSAGRHPGSPAWATLLLHLIPLPLSLFSPSTSLPYSSLSLPLPLYFSTLFLSLSLSPSPPLLLYLIPLSLSPSPPLLLHPIPPFQVLVIYIYIYIHTYIHTYMHNAFVASGPFDSPRAEAEGPRPSGPLILPSWSWRAKAYLVWFLYKIEVRPNKKYIYI